MGGDRRALLTGAGLVGAVLAVGSLALAVAADRPSDIAASERVGATGSTSATAATTESGEDAKATTTTSEPAAPTTTEPAPTSTTAPPTTVAPPPPAVAPALAPVLAGEAPVAAGDPAGLAEQILAAERAVRDPASPPELVAAGGRLQQVAYRRLGDHPEWEPEVLARTPPELRETVWRHATARREFEAMHTRLGENLPAWKIVDPLPAEELLGLYREAEGRFGVPWNVLAAVHLVETSLGRIVGLSSAGAQGPMQFMPATWEAYGMGGDVWNTRDAILGAANYLAANGGASGTPEGLANALFHYNRSDHYVQGVLHYAAIMAAEPRTYLGMHAWPVVYTTVLGDIVLPTGYEQPEPIPAAEWLAAHGG